jgi:hypothetical protein
VPPNETRANSRRDLRVRERPLDPASRATEVRSHPRSDCNAPEPNDESPVVVDDETPGAFNACFSRAARRLTSMRGYLERGAIWNARLFAHRRLYIFPTFLSFQLIAEKPQPTRSAFGFFQATGSEEVCSIVNFGVIESCLIAPKLSRMHSFTGEFHRNFLKGFFWLAAPKIGELILSKKHSK